LDFGAKIETTNRSDSRVTLRLNSLVLLGILSKNRGAKEKKMKKKEKKK
jgi:hypothetical protein